MSRISEKKLNASFEPFQTLDLPYIKKAKEAVRQYQETGKIDKKLMREIRIEAVNDTKHLKGDFVVSMLIEITTIQQQKPYKGGGKKGRTMLPKSQQEKVFRELKNGKPVALIAKDLCVSKGLIYRLKKNNPKKIKGDKENEPTSTNT